MQTSMNEDAFIYTGTSAALRKARQDNKATRMDETALLDELAKAFQEYRYWPMSALKKRLKQPEAWLKEVLGKIAVLVRTGQAANHYMLKQFAEEAGGVKEEEFAPEVKGEEDDDEDEDMDFEEVA